MPTSSQAMILQHEGGSSTKVGLHRGKSSTDSIVCPVVNFDINETFRVGFGIERSKELEEHKVYTRKSECNRDGPSIRSPLSCRGLLLYDSETGVYFWKDIQENTPVKAVSLCSHQRDEEPKDPGYMAVGIVKSEVEQGSTESSSRGSPSVCSMYGLNEESYERLVGLGFRKPSDTEQDHVKLHHRSTPKLLADNRLRSNTSNVVKQSGIKKTVSFGTGFSDKICTEAVRQQERSPHKTGDDEADAEKEEIDHRKREKIIGLLDFIKEQTNWDNRISPSVFMRKEKAPSRPTSVCFSLPKSADYSHQKSRCYLKI
ncbi:hypothetical protein ScPMuIL_011928 [Solemya velum]